MDLFFYLFLFITGIVVGIFSGLLGIGGALLMFPILLYLPAFINLPSISVHMITGITSMQTTFGTAAAAYFHHKTGNVNGKLVINIGIGIALGAFIGSIVSKYMSGIVLIWIYVVVLIIAAILLMMRKSDFDDDLDHSRIKDSRIMFFMFGFVIGLPCGILGLAGSVIIIPLLNTLFDVPIKICISSGTHIAFIASFITFIGKALTGQLELISAIIISISATIGAFIGTQLNKKADPEVLKKLLLVIIIVALIKIFANILFGY